MNNFGEKVSFIWGVADLIRDSFKRGKYQDVILPFTVLRRIDCVLAPTKEKVLVENAKLRAKKLENPAPRLCKVSGYAFYNTCKDLDSGFRRNDAGIPHRPHLRRRDRKNRCARGPGYRVVLSSVDAVSLNKNAAY